ncbi:MAG: stage III sporulation protein AG, partial [Candidatus Frackibacter sp. T328-2]
MTKDEFKEKISQIFSSDNFKLLRRIIILILAGVIFITLGNLADPNRSESFDTGIKSDKQRTKDYSQKSNPELVMENKLNQILSSISGVGRVAVD